MKKTAMRGLCALLSLVLVLGLVLSPICVKAEESKTKAEIAVETAVDNCYRAQKIVDLIVSYIIDGEYAGIFTGSSTSSIIKSVAIDMIIDELSNHEDLMIGFGFEPTQENKELVAEEIYVAACIYYDELNREGGSKESANKLTIIELIRFALIETEGYSNEDALETAKFRHELNRIYETEGQDAAISYAESVLNTVVRLSGAGRVETAIAVADTLKAALGRDHFDAIIIANGDNFADALTGSYLANVKVAPILLYRKSGVALNEEYIRKNLSKNGVVYILGGPAAVPATVEESLISSGFTVKRLSGDSRFDTNLKILEEAGVSNQEILICTGWEYADSLSASATGLPILMLNTIKNELTPSQTQFLKAHASNSFTIIGGTKAVSEKLAADVDAIAGNVDRIYGEGREATSVAVANRYFKNPAHVLLAYSRNFPDGLCGGPLANALGAPLILTNAGKEVIARDYVSVNGIEKGYVLGGPVAISEATIEAIFG